MTILRCTADRQCDFHRDGGAADEKCPWYCDADGCQEEASVEVDGHAYCRADAARVLGSS